MEDKNQSVNEEEVTVAAEGCGQKPALSLNAVPRFTPAPWGIMRDGPMGDGRPWTANMEAAPELTIGCISNTEPVARVSGYLMPVDANARLIAAAPKLHSALETINALACYASEENTDAREAALLEIGNTARAALNLAEA